jgi:hypothetical protein
MILEIPPTEGQFRYSDHNRNYLDFLRSFCFAKVSSMFNFRAATKKATKPFIDRTGQASRIISVEWDQ